MSSTVLFIADLHLSPQHPEIFQRFKDFLHEKARHARALYILGDLFEYYLGDDAMDELASQTALELQQLNSKYQTECYFMPGNRDFLVSNGFAQKANLTILTDPTVIQLEDKKIILLLSIKLCTSSRSSLYIILLSVVFELKPNKYCCNSLTKFKSKSFSF